jgi:hypothetical protein
VTPELNSLEKMIKNLFFKDFDGKTFNLADVPSSWTVSALQKRVGMERGYDPNTLRLLWSGRSLESGKLCCSCLLSTIRLSERAQKKPWSPTPLEM